MSDDLTGRKTPADRPRLVPRYQGQGYRDDLIARRRAWIEDLTGVPLRHVGGTSLSGESMRGNVENPIGTAQVPLGLAGPLAVRGEAAEGVFYVPLATTEGALVRSYERGMLALTRAGGAEVRVTRDENCLSPVLRCSGLAEATALAGWLPAHRAELAAAAEATTGHGKLVAVEAVPIGREVLATFRFSTGDAQGMNMVARATEAACRWLMEAGKASSFLLMSGASGEKRASGRLLAGGKGKTVTAGAVLSATVLDSVLGVTAAQMLELWRHTVRGQLHAGTLGYQGHVGNGLTAFFIACGQDVANVVNAAVAVTSFEPAGDDSLYAAVHLPALPVATVGGGTGLGTARECLELLGCYGAGRAARLAEIAGATVLAGELSMGAALASGEMVTAHEAYGRNRPSED
jgi:hydroxymethylglutaryl-CoA reductase (NADPH)